MSKVKLYITDEGDSSVGIFPVAWTVDVPFIDMDEEERIIFAESIKNAYAELSEGGRITAMYSDQQADY